MVKVAVFIIHWSNKWWISSLSDQSRNFITLTQPFLWYTHKNPHSLCFHFVETYHHRCHFPAAVRFHPTHGIRLRWWNCSPLQEPPPLWAAEWCLPMTPTMTRFRTSNQVECTIYKWRGGWRSGKEGCIDPRGCDSHPHAAERCSLSVHIINSQQRRDRTAMNSWLKYQNSSPGVTIYFYILHDKHILLKI